MYEVYKGQYSTGYAVKEIEDIKKLFMDIDFVRDNIDAWHTTALTVSDIVIDFQADACAYTTIHFYDADGKPDFALLDFKGLKVA